MLRLMDRGSSHFEMLSLESGQICNPKNYWIRKIRGFRTLLLFWNEAAFIFPLEAYQQSLCILSSFSLKFLL